MSTEGQPERIQPAARAVMLDNAGRVLLIRREDNHMWGLPAGGMEPGESVTDCMKREVWEETGLEVVLAEAFAIYSEPRFMHPTLPVQLLTVGYRVTEWNGTLVSETDETLDARWFTLEELRNLHDLMPMYLETIEDCMAFDGKFVVK